MLSVVSVLKIKMQSRVCTHFILKIDQILYTVPVSDFLPKSICSVQLDAASVENRLGA